MSNAHRAIGTVRLKNAVFYAHHGVMQEEHRLGGRYEVDVSIDVDFEEAARTDDLAATVDYETIYRLVEKIVIRNRFYLIERLAYLIAHQVRETYPSVVSVEVAVRKPNPPVGGTADYAEAVYRI
jgi:7,8-dihydroneopterin aldolase/epimerase/oxygenase